MSPPIPKGYELKNAVIESVRIDNERGLRMWIMLDYGESGQVFGGFLLYRPADWGEPRQVQPSVNFCGHFIYRCLQVAGVGELNQMEGKAVRAIASDGRCKAIGHIVKDDWFDPEAELEQLKKTAEANA